MNDTIKTSVNSRGVNKKTLMKLVITIVALFVISVVYIIIFPSL
jgi:hypothetical protein